MNKSLLEASSRFLQQPQYIAVTSHRCGAFVAGAPNERLRTADPPCTCRLSHDHKFSPGILLHRQMGPFSSILSEGFLPELLRFGRQWNGWQWLNTSAAIDYSLTCITRNQSSAYSRIVAGLFSQTGSKSANTNRSRSTTSPLRTSMG
jgi:hypothetical protein